MTNAEIADIFSLLAKLMDLHGENAFKTKSYQNAAFQIDRMEEALSDIPREQWAGLKGIGESTAHKIAELMDTGTLQALQDLLQRTPDGILEMMRIKGIGPKKLATIWKELGIESPGELLYACYENRLVHYKGFGEKTQQSIREALEFYLANQQKFLYAQAEAPAQLALKDLQKKLGVRAALSGAIIRQEDIINELEIVVECSEEQMASLFESPDWQAGKDEYPGGTAALYHNMLKVCLIAAPDTFDTTCFLQSFTEPCRTLLPEIPFPAQSGETAWFSAAGLQPIPPALRHRPECVDLAKEQALPELIAEKDIRGVIHSHSTWSDGSHTIEQMARACMARGYEYLVMSDHSVSSFYANGLNADRIRQQHEEIDRLNELLNPFRIFKSIECDILYEGQLDYPDAVLDSFDLVIASVHQHLNMSNEKAMQRLLRAVEHPATRILGHPTGRLLLSRRAYPVNFSRLIEACAKHGVVIEINANPRRLDMDQEWLPTAMQHQVMLSINPDAHSTEGIDDIRYGVISARRGMLQEKNNLSSMGQAAFDQWVKAGKQKA